MKARAVAMKRVILNGYPIVVAALGLAMTMVWIALLCYAAFAWVF
jgi:hypothetical protein